MPVLTTRRLVVRPFRLDDLQLVHQLLDIEIESPSPEEPAMSLADRKAWLEWTVMSYHQLAQLYQPPFGDRAVVLRQSGELIGACGFVPSLAPFEQYPQFRLDRSPAALTLNTPEIGLFYAIGPRCRRRGYASEAALALVQYAFERLIVKRIVATTTRENFASIGVMRRLGMRVEENPFPEPHWSQVVGVLNHPLPQEGEAQPG
jgi:RimJ/RimL family protein N-acetyltransferase